MADNDLDYNAIVEILSKKEEEAEEKERRRKPDWLTIMPVVLSWTSAFMVVAVWFLLDQVGPKLGSDWGWLTFFGYTPQPFRWPRGPVNVAYVMLIVSMVLCVIAFIGNTRRMKRKGDKYRVSIFIIGAIALITFVSFLVKFLPMGILGF